MEYYRDLSDIDELGVIYDMGKMKAWKRIAWSTVRTFVIELQYILEIKKKLAFEQGVKNSSKKEYWELSELQKYYRKSRVIIDLTV